MGGRGSDAVKPGRVRDAGVIAPIEFNMTRFLLLALASSSGLPPAYSRWIRRSMPTSRSSAGRWPCSTATGNAGLHVKLPWPIQSVQRLDRRVQLFDLPPAELLTHDPQGRTIDRTLTVEAYVCLADRRGGRRGSVPADCRHAGASPGHPRPARQRPARGGRRHAAAGRASQRDRCGGRGRAVRAAA